jgi:hypothetical protein
MAEVPVNQPNRKNTDARDVSQCDEDLMGSVPEATGGLSRTTATFPQSV